MKTWLDDYIHICICEDNLNDKEYLKKCLDNLIELCADITKKYSFKAKEIYDHSELSDYPDVNY